MDHLSTHGGLPLDTFAVLDTFPPFQDRARFPRAEERDCTDMDPNLEAFLPHHTPPHPQGDASFLLSFHRLPATGSGISFSVIITLTRNQAQASITRNPWHTRRISFPFTDTQRSAAFLQHTNDATVGQRGDGNLTGPNMQRITPEPKSFTHKTAKERRKRTNGRTARLLIDCYCFFSRIHGNRKKRRAPRDDDVQGRELIRMGGPGNTARIFWTTFCFLFGSPSRRCPFRQSSRLQTFLASRASYTFSFFLRFESASRGLGKMLAWIYPSFASSYF